MSHAPHDLRAFKPVFTAIGVTYVILASSMLLRGVAVLRDFAVPDVIVASPVMNDFFTFFYQLMAVYGVLMVLFAQVTRGDAQRYVAAAFFALNVLATLRDLSTSDSPYGNRLYRGEATMVFVYLDALFATLFAAVALSRARSRRPQEQA